MKSGAPIIHVLTVEDHPLALNGMEQLVRGSHNLRLVAACGTRDEALDKFKENRVDVVLFDLNLHGLHEWRTIKRMRELKPAARIVVISAVQEFDVPAKAFQLTRAFLTKHSSNEEIVQAIHDAHEGKDIWPKGWPPPSDNPGPDQAPGPTGTPGPVKPFGLSDAQIEVLRLLQDGREISEIASILNLGQSAIRKRCDDIRNNENIQIGKLRDLYLWAVKNRPLDRANGQAAQSGTDEKPD